MSETIPTTPAEASLAPAPVAPAVVAPAPVVAAEAPPTEAPAPAPTSVIGDALAPVAPVEAAPAPDAAPIVEGQSAEPAPPPAFEPFKLPDGVELQGERLSEFTNLLGSFEGETKAEHAKVQDLGQQLIDRHVAEVQRAVAEVHKANVTGWENLKATWKDQFMNDPEIGGNRFQTTVDSATGFIRTHGGSDAQQAEFRQLMNDSGLGNHPVMIRLLAKAGAAMSEGRPLAAQPGSPPLSKTQKLYGQRG